MKRIVFLGLLAALAAVQAPAEEPRHTKGDKQEPKKPNPCAAYGPGFIMLRDTTTCVRIGGSAVGDFSARRGAAPNLGGK